MAATACTAPGCTSYRNLHRHHIVFRSHRGSNQPSNLTTLCAWHHERGVHGYENRSESTVRLLMFSEQNAPNVSVYPDAGQVGIYDVAKPDERRFGALFDLEDAVEGYDGSEPKT